MKRINISFYILVLSALTVGLVISALLSKASPLFTSNTLFLCQKFISNIMLEIPRSLPNILILTVGVVLGTGLLSFLIQLIKTHLFLRKLLVKRIDISSDLAKMLETLNLTNKGILVKDRNLLSFCCGIFSPFIMVSAGLAKSLTPKDIEAVNELLAYQWTISHQQRSTFLRSALKKILAPPELNLATVSNASGPDYFEIRIHRLINPGIKCRFRLSLVSLLTTFLFVLVSWFLLQTPVSASHMDSMSNPGYFLCSVDQSCSEQCHSDIKQPTNYIPTN